MADIQLTDEQMSAVEMVKANKVGVLTGGPGTGKTTTVNEILNWADSQRMTMAMAAPTGKAAKRMTEATGREASTIHRLLAGEMRGDKFVFAMGERCPLHVDLLVVDEVSMVTSELMADLLRAVKADGTRVLIVRGRVWQVTHAFCLEYFLPHMLLDDDGKERDLKGLRSQWQNMLTV